MLFCCFSPSMTGRCLCVPVREVPQVPPPPQSLFCLPTTSGASGATPQKHQQHHALITSYCTPPPHTHKPVVSYPADVHSSLDDSWILGLSVDQSRGVSGSQWGLSCPECGFKNKKSRIGAIGVLAGITVTSYVFAEAFVTGEPWFLG